MFQHILVPVDLSERSLEPVRVAGRLARASGGSITLLHVVESLDIPWEEFADFREELERKARAHLGRLAVMLGETGVTVEEQVRYGKRTPEILEVANSGEFDLVVVGSHRLTPQNLAGGFLTISHQLAIASTAPVLILKQ